jgi:hypothetical protein
VDFKLKHLFVVPSGGLCNRLHPIASARRLCSITGAKCTVIWDWGDFADFFQDIGVEIQPSLPAEATAYPKITHRLFAKGGDIHNRVVPITTEEYVVVFSQYIFSAEEEPLLFAQEAAILPWLPCPSDSVKRSILDFQLEHFDRPVAGIHLRRTDNRPAQWGSPDENYIEITDRLIKDGYKLFIATDNLDVQAGFKRRYAPECLCFYPKNPELKLRWPRREFSQQETYVDVVDLFLLVACDFVIGSQYSSYSRTAVALNGSRRSLLIGDPQLNRELWLRASKTAR